ncbi:MAG: hypothetical protein GWP14_00890 [Actinobacteria bacterium]|nr:hypothetical protein [Actinomycetota bacterium]
MSAYLKSLELLSLSIPFRRPFRHSTAERSVSENLIVIAELSDGSVGFGESIAREYVSGETISGAATSIKTVLAPLLADLAPVSFPDLLNKLEELPLVGRRGKPIVAARCAVELALLDAFGRHFRRGLQEIVGWLGVPDFRLDGSLNSVRFSGVLSADDPRQITGKLRKMRLFGLRDFKIKLGTDHDEDILRAVHRPLARGLRSKRYSLRADVNGVWDLDKALDTFPLLAGFDICCVEQPLSPRDQSVYSLLRTKVAVPIMVDESLVLPSQAQAFIDERSVDFFNIRISKNGGLIPALRLAHLARKADISYQLGCMVGETAILSAAGRWFLSMVPEVTFAEGSYGTFLLSDDISDRSSRFGYGGRIKRPMGPGLGVTVDLPKLRRYQTALLATIAF